MFIVLLGPPGAGKGTQAQVLAEKLGLTHLATGNLFREAIRAMTPLGQQAAPYIERGDLVPDDLTLQMVREQLARPENRRGVVFDGFPRTVEQSIALARVMEGLGQHIDAAVLIKVPIDELVRRLTQRWTCPKCGAVYHLTKNPPRVDGRCDVCGAELRQRVDDSPPVVRRRLEVFQQQTAPVVDFYRKKGLLVEVNGNQPVPEVTHDILNNLRDRQVVGTTTRCQSS